MRVYLLVPFLGFFLGMIILDQEPGWNIALLAGFALTAGLLLNWSGSNPSQWLTWVLFLGLGGVSLTGAAVMGERFQTWMRVLLALTVIYLLGWLALITLDLAPGYRGFWILTGLLLFTLITMGILQRGVKSDQDSSPVPLAIELFVVLFNLFWLSGLVSLGG
jgi:hypothetical protein